MAEKDIFSVEIEDPKTNINDYSWTFYGDAGFGKSSLCAVLFDDAMFFQWEQGQNALRAKKWNAPDWKTFSNDIKKLQLGAKAGKTIPFKTAIMDTVDIAITCCLQKVCLDNGWSHPSEGEWGAGWSAVSTEFDLKMKNLEDLGVPPVYISHVKDKEVKPKKGEKYNKIVPTIGSSGSEAVIGKVDFIGYCAFEKDEDGNIVRRIYFRSNGDFEAKSRLLFFPEFVEYGNSPKEAAYNIRKAFDNAVFEEFGIKVDNAGKLPFASEFANADTTNKKEKVKVVTQQPSIMDEQKVDTDDVKPESQAETETGYVEEQDGESLVEIVQKCEDKFTQLMNDGEITAQGIVKTLKKYTGFGKFSQINDISKAKELLEHINTL